MAMGSQTLGQAQAAPINFDRRIHGNEGAPGDEQLGKTGRSLKEPLLRRTFQRGAPGRFSINERLAQRLVMYIMLNTMKEDGSRTTLSSKPGTSIP